MISPIFILTNGIHATDHRDKNPSESGNNEDIDTKDSADMLFHFVLSVQPNYSMYCIYSFCSSCWSNHNYAVVNWNSSPLTFWDISRNLFCLVLIFNTPSDGVYKTDHKNIMINNPRIKIVNCSGWKNAFIMTKIVCTISIATCCLRLPIFWVYLSELSAKALGFGKHRHKVWWMENNTWVP